ARAPTRLLAPLRDGSSAAVLRDVGWLAPRLVGSVSRSPLRTFRTSLATHSADRRYGARAVMTRSCFVRPGSTGRDLVVDHSPRQSTAAHFGFASACVPTDGGAATKTADPAAPWKVTRSPESGLPPTASELTPHLADHVSASGVRQRESSPDGRPGIRFPVPPSGSQTTASIPWLRYPRAPGVAARNKTLARCRLRAWELALLPLPLWCPT